MTTPTVSRVPLLAAGAAALAWLPFVARPATPDEGGYLLVASQWGFGSGGSSLYGDYWVDRPPLLITIYQVADRLGGVVPLRLLGVVAIVVSVLLAARLAGELAPGSTGLDGQSMELSAVATPNISMNTRPAGYSWRPGSGPAVVTAALMTTPLCGGLNVNGELFAVPFLLAGLLALVRAAREDRTRWWLLAGAAGAAAALVKQSQVDLVVVALVVVGLRVRSHGGRAAAVAALRLLTGGLLVTAAMLGWAWLHGTDPGGLWRAVVVFRFDAAAVIGNSPPGVTGRRALGLAGAFVGCGAPLLIGLLALGWRRAGRRPVRGVDARILAATLLAWELVGVGFGGSYWLHYLVGLTPGLVVATAVAAPRALRTVTVYAAVSAVASVVVFAAVGGRAPEDDIAAYLRAHRHAGDTLSVAFGRPHIVYDAEMSSPYDDLWSLPVRVRDRHLVRFTQVLAGPDRPTWLVVAGDDLSTWGITDTAAAEAQVSLHYTQVARVPGYRILHADADVG